MLKSTLTLLTVFVVLGFTVPLNQSEVNETTPAEVGKVIEVTMKDFSFSPEKITVPSGEKITLKIMNDGTVSHEFHVGKNLQGNGFEAHLFEGVEIEKSKKPAGMQKSEKGEEESHKHGKNMIELKPGQSGKLTFSLSESKQGTYTIACFESIKGQKHHKKGMKGTLVVK